MSSSASRFDTSRRTLDTEFSDLRRLWKDRVGDHFERSFQSRFDTDLSRLANLAEQLDQALAAAEVEVDAVLSSR